MLPATGPHVEQAKNVHCLCCSIVLSRSQTKHICNVTSTGIIFPRNVCARILSMAENDLSSTLSFVEVAWLAGYLLAIHIQSNTVQCKSFEIKCLLRYYTTFVFGDHFCRSKLFFLTFLGGISPDIAVINQKFKIRPPLHHSP